MTKPLTWDPAEIVRREATRIAADASAPPELRAAARDHLLAPTIDEIAERLGELSPAALAALAELDESTGTPIGIEGTTRPPESIAEDLSTRARRDRTYAKLLEVTDECHRLAGIVSRLDGELAADTSRPTPAPPPVTLAAAADDETAPEPIVSAPVTAPRTAEEWRAHCRELVERHRAAEAERSAQRTAELEQWRARERAKIVEREQRERRRRGDR